MVKVTVSGKPDQRWTFAGSIFFHAIAETGDIVTLELPLVRWAEIERRWPDSASAKLERLALTGRWANVGDERAWRVALP